MKTDISEVLARIAERNPHLKVNTDAALESLSSSDAFSSGFITTERAKAICSRFGIAIDDPNDPHSLATAFAEALVTAEAALNSVPSPEDDIVEQDLTDDEVIEIRNYVRKFTHFSQMFDKCNRPEFFKGMRRTLQVAYAEALIDRCINFDVEPSGYWTNILQGGSVNG